MTMRAIGTFPAGYAETFTAGDDPVAVLLREAIAKADRERAEAERIRLAAIADAERAKRTRRARAMRRLGKALNVLARLR